MIQFEDALKQVLSTDYEVGTERVFMTDALGRVLAESVISDISMPPFNKTAVDGYACRLEDLGGEMRVIEVIPAGSMPENPVGKGQCSKIMTGAPVPRGADCVIPVEDVETFAPDKIRFIKEKVKDNICIRGEDISEGDVVVPSGTLIGPQHIALLATAGKVRPKVYRKIRVAVISTGNELVEPDEKPGISKIRNSNAYQLIAQIRRCGCLADYIGIATDTEEDTRKKITRALDGNDVILISGGISMGDLDLVPQVLNGLGIEIRFKTIAVQPGRPTIFGVKSRQFVFGLPGNPVSSFIQFELLVKPLLYKLSGHDYQPVNWRLPMAEAYKRSRSGRLSWVPVSVNQQGEVVPVEFHGSAHIGAMAKAHGLIAVEIGKTEINKGELVNVRQV